MILSLKVILYIRFIISLLINSTNPTIANIAWFFRAKAYIFRTKTPLSSRRSLADDILCSLFFMWLLCGTQNAHLVMGQSLMLLSSLSVYMKDGKSLRMHRYSDLFQDASSSFENYLHNTITFLFLCVIYLHTVCLCSYLGMCTFNLFLFNIVFKVI
jgi:hypothetical protein